MAGQLFKLGDGGTMIIRTIDVHQEAEAMCRRLGIHGQIQTMVGSWDENGQLTGWTKKGPRREDDILVEVFVSKLDEKNREFDRYAREMQKLIDENKALKAKLSEPA